MANRFNIFDQFKALGEMVNPFNTVSRLQSLDERQAAVNEALTASQNFQKTGAINPQEQISALTSSFNAPQTLNVASVPSGERTLNIAPAPQQTAQASTPSVVSSGATVQGVQGGDIANIQSQLNALTQQAQQLQVAAQNLQQPTQPQQAQPDEFAVRQGQIQAQISALQQQLLQSLQPTQEEISVGNQLAQLRQSTREGVLAEEGLGRPLALVTGRQRKLLEQADIREDTLENRLARLQARRQAAADVSATGLSFAEREIDRLESRRAEMRAEKRAERAEATRREERAEERAFERERFQESQFRADRQFDLMMQKFNEDRRQFNAQIAQQNKERDFDRLMEGLEKSEKEALQKKNAIAESDAALTAIDNIFDIMGRNSAFIEGAAAEPFVRSVARFIPGTESRDLQSSLDTVKALVGFDTLTKMRNASPTGGALGQVSDKEIRFLQSVRGSLDIGQSTQQLAQTLLQIEDSFATLRLVNSPDGTIATLDGVTYEKRGDQFIPIQ